MKCEEFLESLSEFLEGDLLSDIQLDMRKHLVECRTCSEQLKRFEDLTESVESLDDPVLSEKTEYEILSQVMQSRSGTPEVMDVEDLLDYLGVTLEELDEELEYLPAFEFAGKLRFRKSKIDEWIDEREAVRRRRMTLVHYRDKAFGA